MYLNLNLGCALIAVLMLLTPAQGVADTSEAVAVSVQRGDTLFSRSSSDKTTWRVIRQLRKALAKEAESFDLLWRLARAYGRLGEVARLKAGDDAAAGARGKDGLYYAAKAIKADPTRVEGHYWAAVCLGLWGNAINPIKALATGIAGRFLKYLRMAKKINPRYEDGGVDRMLAMYHHKVPFPLKDNTKAFYLINEARKRSPGHTRNIYCWARILQGVGRTAKAREQLKRCVAVDPKKGDRAINQLFQSRCRALLAALAYNDSPR